MFDGYVVEFDDVKLGYCTIRLHQSNFLLAFPLLFLFLTLLFGQHLV